MAGGAIGAAARWAVTLVCEWTFGPAFPLGTLLVNVIGSTALGFLLAAMPGEGVAERRTRLLVGTGLLGGLTTFSTWTGDVVRLAESGRSLSTGIHLAGTLSLGLGGFVAGYALGVTARRWWMGT